MKHFITVLWLMWAWLLGNAGTGHAAGDTSVCAMCGMDLARYKHTLYTVRWKDGTEQRTCGVQCGFSLQLTNPDGFRKALARDLLSNRAFDASGGFYAYRSGVVTDMAPGFIAFEKRSHADMFRNGFGGIVLSYDEAMEAWRMARRTGK